jgi:hypothetical protein
MKKTISNQQKVRNHLTKKKSITSWEAIEKYSVTRLAAIIHNLRKDGWLIESKQFTGKDSNSNFVKYVLIKKK